MIAADTTQLVEELRQVLRSERDCADLDTAMAVWAYDRLADAGVHVEPDELRHIRWVAGWEPQLLATVVALVLRGRGRPDEEAAFEATEAGISAVVGALR